MRPINVKIDGKSIFVEIDEENSFGLNLKEAERLSDLLSFAIIDVVQETNILDVNIKVRNFKSRVKELFNGKK